MAEVQGRAERTMYSSEKPQTTFDLLRSVWVTKVTAAAFRIFTMLPAVILYGQRNSSVVMRFRCHPKHLVALTGPRERGKQEVNLGSGK